MSGTRVLVEDRGSSIHRGRPLLVVVVMQNERELIRLRRELPEPEPGARNFACGANYLAPGWFKICLRRKLPAPDTKGGLFLYLC